MELLLFRGNLNLYLVHNILLFLVHKYVRLYILTLFMTSIQSVLQIILYGTLYKFPSPFAVLHYITLHYITLQYMYFQPPIPWVPASVSRG